MNQFFVIFAVILKYVHLNYENPDVCLKTNLGEN